MPRGLQGTVLLSNTPCDFHLELNYKVCFNNVGHTSEEKNRLGLPKRTM